VMTNGQTARRFGYERPARRGQSGGINEQPPQKRAAEKTALAYPWEAVVRPGPPRQNIVGGRTTVHHKRDLDHRPNSAAVNLK
jgi:hypothetical protein